MSNCREIKRDANALNIQPIVKVDYIKQKEVREHVNSHEPAPEPATEPAWVDFSVVKFQRGLVRWAPEPVWVNAIF